MKLIGNCERGTRSVEKGGGQHVFYDIKAERWLMGVGEHKEEEKRGEKQQRQLKEHITMKNNSF